MDSDDDLELLAEEAAAPPVHDRKLKRLKKAVRVSEDPLPDLPGIGPVNSSEFEALSLEESNDPSRLQIRSESLGGDGETISGSDGLDGEGDKDSGGEGGDGEIKSCFGGSGVGGGGGGEDGGGAKRVLNFGDEVEEFREEGEERNGEIPEENGEMRVEETDKKRRSSDEFMEFNGKKKRSKRAKSETAAVAEGSGKRRTEKERRDHLKQLHAESQRLLRETRDASFKPVPIVQKPISSVLEKIRKRKLEVLQKRSGSGMGSQLHAADEPNEEPIVCQTEMGSGANGVCMDGSSDDVEQSSGENVSSRMDVDEESKQTFRAPVDDTQELFSNSQATEAKDDMPNDSPSSPQEEVFAPSILAMNLKLDSAPPDDVSSDEEDNYDKENIDPRTSVATDLPSSPIGDPVKAFVDDEAEEEDDSDHDMQFQDSEEDEDDGDAAELNDMIATGYEERPIDGERRNELHQKWLEQQDASGTEKLMQKLKFGSKRKEKTMLEDAFGEDSDIEKESDGVESDGVQELDGEIDADEEEYENDVKMSLRQIKQMLPLMYTDNDDVYLSSDDEETETRLAKQCLSEKTEGQTTFLSPAEDESSREVFGFIKKLNVVPDNKKAKTPAFSNMLLMGGDRVISSKSSFLGRGSNHSLPSSRKNGLSTVRSIIFGPGSSLSRTKTLMSEGSSDTIQSENQPTNTSSAKFSKSKVRTTQKSSTSDTSTEAVPKTGASAAAVTNSKITTEAVLKTNTSVETVLRTHTSAEAVVKTSTSPPLLNMLRQTRSKRCTEESMIGQIEAALSSFNVGRRTSVQPNRRT